MSKVLIVVLGCLVASLGTLLVLLSFAPEERRDATGQTLSFSELTRQPVSSTFDRSNNKPPSQTSGQLLQRILRDVHTLSGHTVFDLDVGGELYGRLLLGLPANAPV